MTADEPADAGGTLLIEKLQARIARLEGEARQAETVIAQLQSEAQEAEALIAQLQSQARLVETLIARIAALEGEAQQTEALKAQVAQLEGDLLVAKHRYALLHEALIKMNRQRFGHRTERGSIDAPGQTHMDLLGQQLHDEQQAQGSGDEASEEDEESISVPAHERRVRGKRQRLSEKYPHLPVHEARFELPESERFDVDGTPLVMAGTEVAEELVIVAPKAYIQRTVRVRYARSDTAEKVTVAPLPARIYPRSMLANVTILLLVVMHADDCLPFHRQAEIFARMGVEIGRQVLLDGFQAWCRLAEPLLACMEAELLRAPVLHIDGTFLKWQDGRRRRRCTRTVMYGISDGDQLLMRWRKDETHASAANLLPGYAGVLVRDEWAGWAKMNGAAFTEAGCNSHARRPFAFLQDDDADAAAMVALYADLYRIEHRVLASGRKGDALLEHRREQRRTLSAPIMDRIEAFAQQLADRRTGSMATAARYILKHRDKLRRFLDDPRLPLDNNLAENVLRRIALLRKNRLFIVSERGGIDLATAMSILGSCRLLGINPQTYLEDCLPALIAHRDATAAGRQPPDLAPWTPAAYARRLHAREGTQDA